MIIFIIHIFINQAATVTRWNDSKETILNLRRALKIFFVSGPSVDKKTQPAGRKKYFLLSLFLKTQFFEALLEVKKVGFLH